MDRLKIREWLYGPGLPGQRSDLRRVRVRRARQGRGRFRGGLARGAGRSGPRSGPRTTGCTSSRSCPARLPAAKLGELDAAWKLTASGNAEISAAWFKLAIAAKYEAAYERIEQFLLTVGRRKFLKPLYAEMAKTPEGLARARAIYAKARPGYHAIATQTLDKMLGEPESRPASPPK